MADEKRYFSVKDMFEQAVTRAKTDPRYEEYSKICELDYDLLCSTCKYDKLYRCEFDVVGEVTYGSSEGIYGDIFLYGNWSKERDDPFKSRARVYVLKTLKQPAMDLSRDKNAEEMKWSPLEMGAAMQAHGA